MTGTHPDILKNKITPPTPFSHKKIKPHSCIPAFLHPNIRILMALEVTYINGKRCYSFEKGNRFFFMKGIEYELLGAESIEGDKTWTGVKHRFKKRFPGPDDDIDERWEVSMLTLTNKILTDQDNGIKSYPIRPS